VYLPIDSDKQTNSRDEIENALSVLEAAAKKEEGVG
jgi:hypothetical protein